MSVKREKIDDKLIARFINDDMSAFDQIYSHFNMRLQKFIYTLVKSEPDTEDLVHEVFVKVWENRGKLKNQSSFENYLFSIAYNSTISLLREKAKNIQYIEYVKSIQIEVEEFDVWKEYKDIDLSAQLNTIVEKLPARQQEIFKLKHFQNLSYKEIAEKLGISVNTVENHMVKAHKFVKENLGNAYLSLLLFVDLFL